MPQLLGSPGISRQLRQGWLGLGLLLVCFSLPAQPLPVPVAADCGEATELPLRLGQQHFRSERPPQGPGRQQEISAPPGDSLWFTREHHSAWYTFISPFSGYLGLDVVPDTVADDYDFLLFEAGADAATACEAIAAKRLLPRRSIISRNDPQLQSRTGLGDDPSVQHVPEGPGLSYGRPLRVRRGQRYYLLLDNVYGGLGHELRFHFYYAPRLYGRVRDALDSTAVAGQVYLRREGEVAWLDSACCDAAGRYRLPRLLEYGQPYELVFRAAGYFGAAQRLTFPWLKAQRGRALDAWLTPIREGVLMELPNLHFKGNEAVFLQEAFPALQELAAVMQRYDSLRIRIEGHVNGAHRPECEQDTFSINLSWRRAQAVQRYLARRGIDPARSELMGFGCTQMLFPRAYNEYQMSRNRRVEVRVLAVGPLPAATPCQKTEGKAAADP